MVENEKLINKENKLPENILSESDTVEIEESNQDTAKADEIKDVSIFGTTFDVNTAKPIEEKSKIKIEEPEPVKVENVTSSYSEEQKKDFNR